MPIFLNLREQFFSQVKLCFSCFRQFLLGLEIHKHFNQDQLITIFYFNKILHLSIIHNITIQILFFFAQK